MSTSNRASYLSFLVFAIVLSSSYCLNFNFGAWEHCYYDPSSDVVDVENALVRIVQSPNHLLGFQAYVNATINQEVEQPVVNLRLWHQETGERVNFGYFDACCGFFFPNEDRCLGDGSKTHCPVSGFKSGMIERLFEVEQAGNYKVEVQLFESDNATDELMCVEISFALDEAFLSKFQEERAQKFSEKKSEEKILLL